MSRDYTPRYIVASHYENANYREEFPAEWRTRRRGQVAGYGTPTAKNLARWAEATNASMLPGGCNAHLAKCGRIVYAEIRENGRDGRTLAVWAAADAPDARAHAEQVLVAMVQGWL